MVRAQLDGAIGWGESIPREYLTGESIATVIQDITRWGQALLGCDAPLATWLDQLHALAAEADGARKTAAWCGLELALLDALGIATEQSVGELLGLTRASRLPWSMPLLAQQPNRLRWQAIAAQNAGYAAVKVKVAMAGSDDRARLSAVRTAAGSQLDLWIDANGGWSTTQAIEHINTLHEAIELAAVEQPLPRVELAGLAQLEHATGVAVSADEALCTQADAEQLCALGSCSIWNVRLAKCGGLLNSLALIERARAADRQLQLGCLVGETSLLAAAGVWLAGAVPRDRLRCFEGCYAPHILRDDPVVRSLSSPAAQLAPHGLGVRIDAQRLARYASAAPHVLQ